MLSGPTTTIVVDNTFIKFFTDYQTFEKFGRPPNTRWNPHDKCWEIEIKKLPNKEALTALKNWGIQAGANTEDIKKLEELIAKTKDWTWKIEKPAYGKGSFLVVNNKKLDDSQRKLLQKLGFKYSNYYNTWSTSNTFATRSIVSRLIFKEPDLELEKYQLKNAYKLPPYLMPFQRDGVINTLKAYELNWNGYLIADEMGLGKTVQAIAIASILLQKEEIDNVLVICPNSLKLQWKNEFLKFEGIKAKVLDSHPRSFKELYLPGVHIINFEALRQTIYKNIEVQQNNKLKVSLIPPLGKRSLVIIDEASKIKNKSTINHKISKQIALESFKILLTGTPYENKLEDFKNILEFLINDFIGYNFFMGNFCITKEIYIKSQYKTVEVIEGFKNLKLFYEIAKPLFIRRVKSEVAKDLPEKIVTRRYIEINETQRNILDTVRKMSFKNQQSELFKWLQHLRVVEDDPFLTSSDEIKQMLPKKESVPPKIEALLDILENLDDKERLLIFTQFAQVADRIAQFLKKAKVGRDIYVITGATSNKKKEELISKFKEKEGGILIATDTLAYGVNLQFVNYLINYDLPWNPAVVQQRINRIHRLGDKEKTTKFIFDFVAHEPSEKFKTVEKLVEEKLYSKSLEFTIAVEGGEDKTNILNVAKEFFIGFKFKK